jgi:nucleotide-binding universal stress UspA family protein
MSGIHSALDLPAKTGPVIVVGFDGGRSAARAAAFAIGVAARQHSTLLFVQVWEHHASHALLPLILPLDQGLLTETQTALSATITDLVGQQDVRWQLRQRIGNPRYELSRIAQDIQADAVIVGASGRAWPRLGSSLGSKLVRAGRCPVTVVP